MDQTATLTATIQHLQRHGEVIITTSNGSPADQYGNFTSTDLITLTGTRSHACKSSTASPECTIKYSENPHFQVVERTTNNKQPLSRSLIKLLTIIRQKYDAECNQSSKYRSLTDPVFLPAGTTVSADEYFSDEVRERQREKGLEYISGKSKSEISKYMKEHNPLAKQVSALRKFLLECGYSVKITCGFKDFTLKTKIAFKNIDDEEYQRTHRSAKTLDANRNLKIKRKPPRRHNDY